MLREVMIAHEMLRVSGMRPLRPKQHGVGDCHASSASMKHARRQQLRVLSLNAAATAQMSDELPKDATETTATPDFEFVRVNE